ncbi:MAG: arginine N-succinyltransferase [Phycisphaerales bacterium]
MYLIRQARIDDLPILMKLARMVYFINLPADSEIITEKILRSRRSFAGQLEDPDRALFMFVLEDIESGSVVGTSQIVARMGFPEAPNTYFELRTREMYADDLQLGAKHMTIQLQSDTDGPTEIGGLILQSNLRGHSEKLGKQLSLIRFHYIGLHPDRFRDELLAEMMAPLKPDGSNAFWEYLGRRFINLSYDEADRLSTKSKTFILNLMPREEMYLSLLPPEARMLVGRVGEETKPARAMLESLGFEYRHHVDPFDGGPHLHAKTQDISIVRETRLVSLEGSCPKSRAKGEALVSYDDESAGFRAVRTPFQRSANGKSIRIPREVIRALEVEDGASVGLTVLNDSGGRPSSTPERSKRSKPGRRRGKRVASG